MLARPDGDLKVLMVIIKGIAALKSLGCALVRILSQRGESFPFEQRFGLMKLSVTASQRYGVASNPRRNIRP